MNNSRIKVSFIIPSVALAAVFLITVFYSIYLYRDIPRLLPLALAIAPIALSFGAVMGLAVFLYLGMPVRVVKAIEAGGQPPLQERLAALKRINRLYILVGCLDLGAFFIGPMARILANALAGKEAVDITESFLVILVSISAGLCCVPVQVNLSQSLLAEERRRLGILVVPEGGKDLSLYVHVSFAAMACILFAGVSLATAGIGFYREFAEWTATIQADAASGASWSGEIAYQAEEAGVLA
jgi:hypothetical protein